jgi:hypothetical protein
MTQLLGLGGVASTKNKVAHVESGDEIFDSNRITLLDPVAAAPGYRSLNWWERIYLSRAQQHTICPFY